MAAKILVVDDDQSFRFLLLEALRKEGYDVTIASSGEEALSLYKPGCFDVVTLDIKMPGMDGFEVLTHIKKIDPEQLLVIITAYGAQKIAIEAVKKGAYDYFTKPFEIDELRVVVQRALECNRLHRENKELKNKLERQYDFNEIVGASGKMMEVFEVMKKISAADITVLIQGESGTGKELVSRAIHANSLRKNGPFVKINCAAIPEGVLESELFGHEKGAFTDALFKKIGRFEAANHGTIFLDEIGDMSLATQAKVLRVLQEREFERVGSTGSIKVDVRIVAATNKDLVRSVKEEQFREDLYYRINVVSVYLPPLRLRHEDIPLLFEHFMRRFNKEFNKSIKHISLEAMELLMKYSWPGNVRELENVLQRAIVLAEKDIITKKDLPFYLQCIDHETKVDTESIDFSKSLPNTVKDVVDNVEKQLILKALNKTNWNRTEAAQLLRISRKSLFNKMKRFNLIENEE
ncbi:MAG: sigma-54 dependent transcriptional regulator [Candidatus Omnitrophica bacterium]|nr:sigma-54 dependent transcriptional regulator [Candidatus Omnitrophota bacterium]MCG2703689.1 sigma-54 dependent transcriptional regulator [Candidatus Omnitrophota bacterium]